MWNNVRIGEGGEEGGIRNSVGGGQRWGRDEFEGELVAGGDADVGRDSAWSRGWA